MNIVNPLPKIYCQGTICGLSMYLTTSGPKDQRRPANKTTGIAIFSFFNSIINECLIKITLNYNKK
jgi:hypothetical protein